MLKVSIIIVNYNTSDELTNCLRSVYEFEKNGFFEIIIVDNNSTDNSKEIIEGLSGKYENVSPIYLNELKSFAFANNRGIEISKGDYILIMNPDIIFEEPLLEKLVAYLNSHDEVGAITPALIGVDGKFQREYFQKMPTIRQFIYFQSFVLRFFYQKDKYISRYLQNYDINMDSGKVYNTNHIPGAFFMVKKKVLDEIGLMDEKFKLFFEDSDLSYRINKKYKLVVDTALKVKHIGATSMKDKDWWVYGRFMVSMIYFFRKHYSRTRYFTLKFLAIYNACFILFLENIKTIFGKQDEFHLRKYRNFLMMLKEK